MNRTLKTLAVASGIVIASSIGISPATASIVEEPPSESVGGCPAQPSGFLLIPSFLAPELEEADRNDDGFVCFKVTKGRGNGGTDFGVTVVDNNSNSKNSASPF